MSLLIKVCGIANEVDARQVAALKPDALGFIFWSGSPRAADPESAGQWNTGSDIQRVGVFVDADEQEMRTAVALARLDVLQLHGDWESVAQAEPLGLPIWKVVHLDKEQPEDWASYPVDVYLLDGYSTSMPGGTGKTVDWASAADFVRSVNKPVLLSGGLHGGNVSEAVGRVAPYGVDASSCLEVAPGKKDIQKVREYISTCREL
jgi:phosphoribosylanthranilate isomerase